MKTARLFVWVVHLLLTAVVMTFTLMAMAQARYGNSAPAAIEGGFFVLALTALAHGFSEAFKTEEK